VVVALELLDEVPAEVRGAAEAGLAAHAQAAGVSSREVMPLCVIARASDSSVIGALAARTVWGWLHISELWVDESHRNAGIGRNLMRMAESAAVKRGCHGCYLDTFDFQAVDFYRRLGYSILGTLEDFPIGHRRYFLQKRLPGTAT
jgi:ribosomal protein S18 acetylase RimI-like enzyme